ncbi:polyadenylate-binding protein-interacting protein 12-like [Senna tora]|uniref:Polyadenylate-binding protein-interacting protein 12-like n=1 Tax=Senna tora TaxID=362788 RepID=A0A834WNT3_9FABA|nr:polyadenylate-binding protein-interacting protein 12-like [Senna tora]
MVGYSLSIGVEQIWFCRILCTAAEPFCRIFCAAAECRLRTKISGFTLADSAIAALNCSGVILGTLPIRVSPSKTPVRSRAP